MAMAMLGVNKGKIKITKKRKDESMAGGFNSSKKAAEFIAKLIEQYREANMDTGWDEDEAEWNNDGEAQPSSPVLTDRTVAFVAGNFTYSFKMFRERIIQPKKMSAPPPMNVKSPV